MHRDGVFVRCFIYQEDNVTIERFFFHSILGLVLNYFQFENFIRCIVHIDCIFISLFSVLCIECRGCMW